MSKQEKLLSRLFTVPTDFKWTEVQSLLTSYGFEEIQKKGSRVRFINREHECLIFLHKPHPEKEICRAAVRDIVFKLKGIGIEP